MTATPRFSIVIPTFGRPQFLAEALESVCAQTFQDFECIVVDDCSPTSAQLPDDSRLRLVRRSANGGPAAARNSGVQAARGEVLLFLDDDDVYTSSRLALAEEGLQRAPLGLCWARYIDEPERPKRTLEGAVGDVILDGMTPHLGTVAIARKLFLPFDETYKATEDVEWWLRTAQRAEVSTVPRFGCLIRRHDGPRLLHGAEARIAGGLRLLAEHREWFALHPRAAAFRWMRIGLTAARHGNHALARSALWRSLRLRVDARVALHLARVCLRSLDPRDAQPAAS
jgi:glycosyltransferase involved in cell wall biosynthesis